VGRYVNEVRPELALASDDGTLFLTRLGEKFNENWLSRTVAQYVEKSGVNKQGSCHLFRHSMATLMLENGADIRFIQAMLGHAELSTTEIYTQVRIKALKEVHSRCHPAKFKKRDDSGDRHADTSM
jgi:integrase/recombinase XerD